MTVVIPVAAVVAGVGLAVIVAAGIGFIVWALSGGDVDEDLFADEDEL